jgi:Ser/Thr protein kinase RdoA (MazF antagonist)
VTIPSHLLTAARHFFGPAARIAAGLPVGFSGSDLARVEVGGRVWCLRRWTPGLPAARLRAIHRALEWSRAEGFAGVPALARTPEGDTILALDGALYDAQGWMPGVSAEGSAPRRARHPNLVRRLPPTQVVVVARQLASFHASLRALPVDEADTRWEPDGQLARVAADLEVQCARLASAVERDGDPDGLANRWLRLLPQVVGVARRVLRDHQPGAWDAPGICHGDLWARHIFFDGEQFAGFVDFEGLVRASPALDLAGVILHCGEWRRRENVLDAYTEVAPLDAAARALLPAAAALDLAAEGLWALERCYASGCGPTERGAHRANLGALLDPLGALCAE